MNANENIDTGTPQNHTHAGGRPARGWRSRRTLVAVTAAGALAAGAVVGSVLASGGVASAATRTGWIVAAGTLNAENTQDPATANHLLNTPTAYGAGASLVRSPIQPGYATTPVLGYTSYAQFNSDIQNGNISYPYQWVMYDPENWSSTPVSEQQNPIKYMTQFGRLAHANGLKVIMAPAQDLGTVSGSVIPRLSGESLPTWFVRANIAGAGAAVSDVFDLQNESQTTNLTQYDSLFNSVAAQARAANARIQVFAEVSTATATAQQMTAAAQSVTANGYYVAAPGAAAQAAQFFNNMEAAGY